MMTEYNEESKFIPEKRSRRINAKVLILVFLPIFAFAISMTMGRYSITLEELFKILASKVNLLTYSYPDTLDTIIFQIRFPRIIAALLVGGALSLAGASYQGMYRNPMVSPDILGASAGAGFGAALGILLSFSIWGIQLTSFLFGLLAVGITYAISNMIGKSNSMMLIMVLTGIVVSTMFQSLISLTKYVADPYSKLPAITFWLMGSLSSVTNSDVAILIIPVLIGVVPLYLIRWKLNVLTFGEEEAKSMGLNTQVILFVVVLCSTLMTSASVAISGLVGWVGLVIPHMARMISGPDYQELIPVCFVFGALFMLIVDDLARNLFSVEIPLSILTALIGAPFFIYLLIKGRRGWN